MRDYVVLAIILGALPICLFRPYLGALMWAWVAYFNPHRYTWGIAYNFPVAVCVGVVTIAGAVLTRDKNRRLFVRETYLLVILWVWFTVTTLYAMQAPEFAAHVSDCQDRYIEVSKILAMTLITVLLVTSPRKLKYLLAVIAVSFGLRAIVGALFGVQTGGEFRVYGPAESFIADNNAFALALNMSLPILFFLAREEKRRLLRFGLNVGFVCGIVSVLLTYSRGGLLGLAAVLAVLAIKSRRKALSVVLLVLFGSLTVSFAPRNWMDRMGTFLQGKFDDSAEMRLISWGFAWNLVHDYPITGGGFKVFVDAPVYQRYQPRPLPGGALVSEAHSVYFEVLGEHGFVGAVLFLSLIGSALLSLRRLRALARENSSLMWVVAYSHMLEVSLVAYLTSGAFLALVYFDLFYQVIGCVILLKLLHRQSAEKATVSSKQLEMSEALMREPVPV